MSLSKILYNVIEANQILNGPCKRKGSEYNRLLRMLKKGVVASMKNGDRYLITKKTLIEHAGSEKIFEEKLRNLYEEKILKNNVNNSEKKEINHTNKHNANSNQLSLKNISNDTNQRKWLKEAFDLTDFKHKDLAIYMKVRPETISRYMSAGKTFIKLSNKNASKIFDFFGFGDYNQLWEKGTIQIGHTTSILDKDINHIKAFQNTEKSISKELREKIIDVKKDISKELSIEIGHINIEVAIPAKNLKL